MAHALCGTHWAALGFSAVTNVHTLACLEEEGLSHATHFLLQPPNHTICPLQGFYFLYYLETLVGGADAMEAFFRAYVVRFAKEPLTSEVFRDFFLEHFISRGVTAVRDIDWQTWFFGLGMPPDVNHYDSSLAQAPYKLAERWHTCDVMGLGSPGPEGASLSDISGWSSAQIVAFLTRLGQLRSLTPLHPTTTRAMNALYGFDASRNAEVRCAWLLLCIKVREIWRLVSHVMLTMSTAPTRPLP